MAQRRSNKRRYSSTLDPEANMWPHEQASVAALIASGYDVKVLINHNREYSRSPDIQIGNRFWEIKSPTSGKLTAVERNLKKAYHQSENIIFDSLRMSRLPDESIQRELIKQFRLTHKIQRLLFINKKRVVIDIGKAKR